jgi:hypothetical protein
MLVPEPSFDGQLEHVEAVAHASRLHHHAFFCRTPTMVKTKHHTPAQLVSNPIAVMGTHLSTPKTQDPRPERAWPRPQGGAGKQAIACCHCSAGPQAPATQHAHASSQPSRSSQARRHTRLRKRSHDAAAASAAAAAAAAWRKADAVAATASALECTSPCKFARQTSARDKERQEQSGEPWREL